MLKIRLMRIGTAKRPFYRVVAVDERKKRTGGYLELLGTYNPLTEPKEIKLDQPKIDEWLKKGAQPSDGFLRIIGKAKQRKPRPAKKEKVSKEAKVSEVSEEKTEENAAPAEDAPVESVESVKSVDTESTETQSTSESSEEKVNI